MSSPQSDRSDRSVRSTTPKTLRPSGGYRKLRSFRAATVIYDATVSFCERFLDQRSRTVDQMVQAARSGRQNIAEGSRASATSSQTELRLVNVARASLDELLLDYEDFLRQRGQAQWAKDAPQAQAVRAVARRLDRTDPTDPSDPTDRSDSDLYAPWLTHPDPAVVANAIICLIHQANYLLDRQIAALERSFIHEGGYSERLAAARIEERRHQVHPLGRPRYKPPVRAEPPVKPEGPGPLCPHCGQVMRWRIARKGARAGEPFWGCPGYPACRGTRPASGSDRSDRSDGSDRSDRQSLLNPKRGSP